MGVGVVSTTLALVSVLRFGDGLIPEVSPDSGRQYGCRRNRDRLLLRMLPLIHPRTRIFCENSRFAGAIACIAIRLSIGEALRTGNYSIAPRKVSSRTVQSSSNARSPQKSRTESRSCSIGVSALAHSIRRSSPNISPAEFAASVTPSVTMIKRSPGCKWV